VNISEFAEDFSQKAMHSDDNLVFADFLKHAIASVLKLENLDDLSNYSMESQLMTHYMILNFRSYAFEHDYFEGCHIGNTTLLVQMLQKDIRRYLGDDIFLNMRQKVDI